MFNRKSFVFLGILTLLSIMIPIQEVQGQPEPESTLAPVEELGKNLFFDSNLSVNRNQSCATCHAPETGYVGANSLVTMAGAIEPGSIEGRFGNRKPPTSAYIGYSPVLHYDEAEGAWIGGMFWDGRATGDVLGDPVAEQAQGPFLNPLEMAMPNARLVCVRVAKSNYVDLFEEVWGVGTAKESFVNQNVELTYERIGRSIAAYERSNEVSPYSSKFDLFWDNAVAAGKDVSKIYMPGSGAGGGMGPPTSPFDWRNYRNLGLSDMELQGLAIFNTPTRADCARCHTTTPGPDGYPLFTDFKYWNLGLPKNSENPYYSLPKGWNPDGSSWIDYGLGGYLKAAGYSPEIYEPEMGKFKTPTLRNVDSRPYPEFVKAYGHNGYFNTFEGLTGIVHFYAWRSMMDGNMPPGGGMGGGGMGGGGMGGGGMTPMPDLFPEPEFNQNRESITWFNFMMQMQGDKIVAFLKTLSDGYVP